MLQLASTSYMESVRKVMAVGKLNIVKWPVKNSSYIGLYINAASGVFREIVWVFKPTHTILKTGSSLQLSYLIG